MSAIVWIVIAVLVIVIIVVAGFLIMKSSSQDILSQLQNSKWREEKTKENITFLVDKQKQTILMNGYGSQYRLINSKLLTLDSDLEKIDLELEGDRLKITETRKRTGTSKVAVFKKE